MNFSKLEAYIVQWAGNKGLLAHTQRQALTQLSKTVEEVEELQEAIATLRASIRDKSESGMWAHRKLQHDVRLEAGDVLVTLVTQCAIQGESLSEADASKRYARAISVPGIAMKNLSNAIHEFPVEDDEKWRFINSSYVASFCCELMKSVELSIRDFELDLEDCLEAAWNKIRVRRGQTIDGFFVKDSV